MQKLCSLLCQDKHTIQNTLKDASATKDGLGSIECLTMCRKQADLHFKGHWVGNDQHYKACGTLTCESRDMQPWFAKCSSDSSEEQTTTLTKIKSTRTHKKHHTNTFPPPPIPISSRLHRLFIEIPSVKSSIQHHWSSILNWLPANVTHLVKLPAYCISQYSFSATHQYIPFTCVHWHTDQNFSTPRNPHVGTMARLMVSVECTPLNFTVSRRNSTI